MASAVDKVQVRLQEAMDEGNQASLGQAIDASKGVNGLKQLRRSAKVSLLHDDPLSERVPMKLMREGIKM